MTKRNHNPPEIDKLSGNVSRYRASREVDVRDYVGAIKDYRDALDSYNKALKNLEGSPKLRYELELLLERTEGEFKDADRRYHLEKQTSHLPKWLGWLVKRVRGIHVIGIFIFALLFSSPKITGSTIGSKVDSSFIGILLFFIGILYCYLFLLSKFYVRRGRNQY